MNNHLVSARVQMSVRVRRRKETSHSLSKQRKGLLNVEWVNMISVEFYKKPSSVQLF